MNRKAKILLTRRWPDRVEQLLRRHYDVTSNPKDEKLCSADLRAAMTTFDALCPTITDAIDRAILDAPQPSVRLIANYGAGVDHIDLVAARKAGISVSNTPDVLTDATAELAILLMLMASRRAGEGERELRRRDWKGWSPTHLTGQSITGKHLGLVGFGRIARATARLARSLGATIAYYSPNRAAPQIEADFQARYQPSVETLVATADIVSIHCPGGFDTYRLFDAKMIARMKPNAILINTARGSVVDELALADALENKIIAGAGLDVFASEPDVPSRLLAIENAVLLPHLGSATVETREAMGMRVVDNLNSFFAGGGLVDNVA